ncbi:MULTISPECIES: hypothetical protein [unclassified Schlesneria]|uniref:hypothetical protein n=1 Tax=unclassified Schlesneria TaxID=2762017 RepID=UPI002EFAB1BD
MTATSRPKRSWRPWYTLPEIPLCVDCKVICIVKHTHTTDDGKRIQHRYCPKCRKPYKTTYRPEPALSTATNDPTSEPASSTAARPSDAGLSKSV